MINFGGKGLMRAVALPAAAAMLLFALLVGTVLHLSTSKSDALEVERQSHLVKIAVQQSITAIANDQEASTYWDDAVLRTRQWPLDLEWIDNNLGIWFYTYYKHDEAYILDPRNMPVYAMQNGVRAQPTSFSRVSSATAEPIASLREKMSVSYVAAKAAPGKTVGAAKIAWVAGRPAIISIKPIVSETGDIVQTPGSEYLHVSVRYLDGNFLDQLSSNYGINKPSFDVSPSAKASLAIDDANGKRLGYIGWQPFTPGKAVEDRMIPVLLAALLLIGALISLLLVRVWRSRTELEASRAQAQHLAFHDSLTGLPNRALFDDRLEHALRSRNRRSAVMMLDLDRFKNINDTLGHQAGDALIRALGLRLSSLVREGDTIARLGGDEFAILIEDAELRDVQHLARRILDEIKRPFEILGSHAYVGVSIGIALSAKAGVDRHEIVRRADIALYRAKEGGRNDYCLFSPEMDARVRLRGTIEGELRDALSTGKGLCVYYQPQVSGDGTIVGLEALVRWDHPSRGLIAPEQFVPVAEDTGLIMELGEWVVREALLVSRRWPHLFVAINLSPIQFRSQGFFANLMRIVRSTGADPGRIQLEVTERVLLDDDDSVRDALAKLRGAGFSIVLDDFGTGYSSLSYLRKFEVDKIKIDRSFIQHLGDASDCSAIVTAVLALGQAMGLAVSAEGVETEEQRLFLDVAGCKVMQGYYFSPALPHDELSQLLDGSGKSIVAA